MSNLFSPGQIGPLNLPNRIVMPSMTTRSASADGEVTESTIAYFRARARGGVGLITVEMASPEAVGRHRHRELGIYHDCYLPGLQRLTAAIKAEGACAAIQLGHGGGHTRVDICGETPIAPSAVPHDVFEGTMETIVPKAMSLGRIEETTAAFVAAAERARIAGFDAVEIHAAHGYLISQFLCPAENFRDDVYGGSLENRARFGLDILAHIKSAVPDLALIYRLTVEDFFSHGMPLSDGIQVAKWAAARGADAIHVTAGHYRSEPPSIMIPPMAMAEATFLDFATQVKARIAVPVIAVARLGDPELAKAAISEGKANFVALGRPLLADPDWPRKVRAGEPVRRCLSCNSCVDSMRGGAPLSCIVNPAMGRESELEGVSISPHNERIAVVGGGPAGLTYASLVSEGNTVTVFERDSRLGGALRLAAKAPLFQEVEPVEDAFDTYICSLVNICCANGVDFHLGADPFTETDMLDGFDRIVLATGARYRLAPVRLAMSLARWPVLRSLFSRDDVRDWLYYRARIATGESLQRRLGKEITVIGDAAAPGKASAAVASAYSAAFSTRAS